MCVLVPGLLFNSSTTMSESAESRGLRFYNKVAIVTGGCRGIGRGCVDVLGIVNA